jgi:ATP-dependent DNA helicase RecG
MGSDNLLAGIRLGELKGIGPKTEKLFGKVGIDNLDQLIHYYPRAYDAYQKCVSVGELVSGEKQAVMIRIKRPPVIKTGKRAAITILTGEDETGRIEMHWFNMPYLRATLKVGESFIFRGMVECKNKRVIMQHPEIFTTDKYETVRGSIQPVYSLTAGLKNKMIAKAVRQVLDRYSFIEYLPKDALDRYELEDRDFAVNKIHFPVSEAELKNARKRLVFDEFLVYLLRLAKINENNRETENQYIIEDTQAADEIIDNLSFELTGAQKKVWQEIRSELMSSHTMNRLLQGDVGSGKTILAFLSMVSVMAKGFQCALMAPTEVLASQHYKSFIKLLEENGMSSDQALLLTGSMTAKEKREAYERISEGKVKAVIGTHAIIQDKVDFNCLALAITDEQHRFGVKQRWIIAEKGFLPHILVMSATPIPRTLALIIYGELKISALDELPSSRLPIKNCVVDESYRKKAYSFIKKQVEIGHQAYIICPMIEPNEDLGCENVMEYTARLKKIFEPDIKVEMLHGRMTADEKLNIMNRFSENKIQVLVSTTVIEVGVDVPNSTVMMIENAERFGLAQLHQLRGRIGRGNAQSYCIFLQGDSKEEDNKRLQILNKSNDGFYIAREDLKLRGQGDLFGLRQSGVAGFSLADPFRDADILIQASNLVKEIMKEDPELSDEKYLLLKEMLDQVKNDLEGIL